MPLGPGKYDNLCTVARQTAKAETVVLIVLGGEYGQGFSCQTSNPMDLLTLPDILRKVARDIETSGGRT